MMKWDMTMTVIRLEEPYDLGPIWIGTFLKMSVFKMCVLKISF